MEHSPDNFPMFETGRSVVELNFFNFDFISDLGFSLPADR